ncbi:MAG: transcription antitermination factor NusB [Erysipelotrichaceae bacterium]|nr:transcription antitermination factor NusB [Erysipelotrichaceae bacterium]
MNRREQRTKVVFSIYQYLLTQKEIEEILNENLDIDDKESISFIVSNTIETLNNLDELQDLIQKHLVDWDFDRLGYIEQAILLFAANEIKAGEIDRPVIINEAVEIAKKYCDDEAPALINGVLDQL